MLAQYYKLNGVRVTSFTLVWIKIITGSRKK